MEAATGYEGEIVLDVAVNSGAAPGLTPLTARFVHYEACQQLTLWLPQDGFAGYEILHIHGPDGAVIERSPVSERLNGRVQILIDTYPWPPGAYRIEITHAAGWQHELALEKLEAGAVRAPAPLPPEESPPGPITYRDGFGNILPDTDLEIREAALKKIAARFSRRIEFEGTFRGGTIIYVEGETRLGFPHEMCGGGVHFSVDIPTRENWEAVTGLSLNERSDIITFLAEETQRRQASSWRYVIHEDRIDFVD